MSRKLLINISETEEEKIKRLTEEKLQLQVALAESIEQQEKDKIELQLAIAEVIESMNKA
ncbi:hypothetical protein Ccar_16445 [Clostridium carboxidivorans P7]|uniref:hypothetical protein n=1 Tax=Clostridium carboxidivorans TaxID=217159 RepID=UPI00064F91BC|nr:hypothetical protein [Clostridium carboxidivorans]AKN32366.1 hypothetical protein Ccar_16445 [Clostridium carboxidivorans P7]